MYSEDNCRWRAQRILAVLGHASTGGYINTLGAPNHVALSSQTLTIQRALGS